MRSHFRLGYPVCGEDFFGRKEYLSRILSALHTGLAVNFFSIRRMGKSSLLRQIRYLCSAHDRWGEFHPVFIDAMGGGGRLASQLLFELGIARRGIAVEHPWLAITKHVREATGKTLLLIDECNYWVDMQVSRPEDSGKELAALRSLHQSGELNIVASTLYSSLVDQLYQFEDLSSPFYNIFQTFRLPAFTPSEAEELIVTLCERGGVRLEHELAAQLAHYVGYYPNLVQEVGHLAFLDRAQGGSARLRVITQQWLQQGGYQWLPTILSTFQKGYIGAVARLAGVSPDDFLSNSLEAYGVLITDEEGQVSVAPYIHDLLVSGYDSEEVAIGFQELKSIASRSSKKEDNLGGTIEKALRIAFRDREPRSESEVQHYIDVILCAAGYAFQKEGPTFVFSLKGYRPDYSSDLENLAIEVKLCKGVQDVRRVVEEMSADVLPYLKRFASVLFIVFDLGGVYDVDRFRSDFETSPKIRVLVIKR